MLLLTGAGLLSQIAISAQGSALGAWCLVLGAVVFVLISDVMCNNISIRTSHPPIRWRPGNFLGRHLYTRGVGMSRS